MWDPNSVTFVEGNPNATSRRGTKIDSIVVHNTGSKGTLEAFVKGALRPKKNKVTSHFYIGRDGRIIQVTPISKRANHAAGIVPELPPPAAGGSRLLNYRSIGIELVNAGDGKDEFPVAQRTALKELVIYLAAKYEIPAGNIVPHQAAKKAKPGGKCFAPAHREHPYEPALNFNWPSFKGQIEGALKKLPARNDLPPLPESSSSRQAPRIPNASVDSAWQSIWNWMFGGAQPIPSVGHHVRERSNDAAYRERSAREAAGQAQRSAQQAAERAQRSAQQAAERAHRSARDAAERAQRAAQQAAEQAQRSARQAAERAHRSALAQNAHRPLSPPHFGKPFQPIHNPVRSAFGDHGVPSWARHQPSQPHSHKSYGHARPHAHSLGAMGGGIGFQSCNKRHW